MKKQFSNTRHFKRSERPILSVMMAVWGTLAAGQGATLTVTSAADDGPGSLRQAILDANASPGLDEIRFSLPTNNLAPLTPLPTVTDTVLIDGWSQPGYSNLPVVGISGAALTNRNAGLEIQADDCTIRGLSIYLFNGAGIRLNGANHSRLEGNIIGLNNPGTDDRGNTQGGIFLLNSASNLLTGNVISGNGSHGISLTGNSAFNVLLGNRIGTDSSGTLKRVNAGHGIDIEGPGAHSNIIGGPGPDHGNLVSGNRDYGIYLDNCASNVVQGNIIGGDIDSVLPLANGNRGILLANGARDNLIGGTEPGTGNRIAFNPFNVGMTSDCGPRNAILGNSIYASRYLGIDLGMDGVTTNDAGDLDLGPNGLQNSPLLTLVRPLAGGTRLEGELHSRANAQFRIELFADRYTAPTPHSRDQLFLGSLLVSSDGAGRAVFQTNLPLTLDPMDVITATATDSSLNTSEFSSGVWVTPACGLVAWNFGTNDEGWMIWKSEVNKFITPKWNPSGWITYDDDGGDGHTSWWFAPTNVVAQASTALGGFLEFELRQSNGSDQYGINDVELSGGGFTLSHRLAYTPGTHWTFFRVPLDDRGGWYANGEKAPPGSMRYVLSALKTVKIRAEYRDGGDTDNLDNVRLVFPPPAVKTSRELAGTRLSWPTWAAGFELETRLNPIAGGWSPLLSTKASNGICYTVLIENSASQQLFRLSRPGTGVVQLRR